MKSIALCLLGLILASCSASKDSTIVLRTGEKLKLDFNKTVTTVISSEPPTLDWIRSSDTDSSWIEEHIMNGLVRFNLADPQLKIEPALAERWENKESGRVWTFYLRKGVQWTDGVELVGQHVVDGWRRLLDPNVAAQAADNLFPIKGAREFNESKIPFSKVGIKLIDEYTIQVELEKPMGFFPLLMTHHTSFPVRQDLIDQHGDLWTEPENLVTLGPYKMIYWHHDSRLVLQKNESYWGAQPQIEYVVFHMIGKSSTQLRMFDRGRIDLMRDLPSAEIPRLKKRPEFHFMPGLRLYYYGYKVRKPPLDNVLVRKALAHAIDRTEIVKVLGGGQFPLKSWVPPGMFGFESDIGLDFNVSKARQLLQQAGYDNPKDLPLIILGFNTEEKHQRVAENIQAQWKKNLGINIEVKNEEWKTYLSGLKTDSA
ncbi:MAG: peptide ABC transporter substrate-binding protein [Bdellovibrionales bacterium]|nr:peptide ABC transporter substrate-binding protein [Bdellovibrionales bacterium]NQZ18815.1 peptide ABC transporter substrate-binding protein [Bdellovibrionales bacterium]